MRAEEPSHVGHRTSEQYEFDTHPDPELEAVVTGYAHVTADADSVPDVRRTWTLEEPAGILEILQPAEEMEQKIPDGLGPEDYPAPEDVGAFRSEFEQRFFLWFSGFRLYFSRVPSLPRSMTFGDPAILGLLRGFPPKDVAQFSVGEKYRFETERNWETVP